MESFKNAEPFVLTGNAQASAGLLRLETWEKFEGLTAGFSTRNGGVSAPPRHTLNTALHVGDAPADVVANRRRVAEELGWDFEAWTCAEQVHGSRVHAVTSADAGRGRLDRESAIPDADALIANEPGILLVMYFADCVPLYFFDPDTNAIGLAHAGWKGTVANVAAATVDEMRKRYGTKPERLLGAVGPSIGACCYEVDEAVLKHVGPLAAELDAHLQEDAQPLVTNAKEGRAQLNLKEFNRHLMIKAGILPSRIEMTTWCTGCRTDLFFSHRQENGATGRMMSWLGMKR
ncbi:peptidoglycan editing factor PgeF [Cohnella thailandensis]|uniref:Purine nucleoside phosphorylase n=1 Tax=Cohnella thailandensis TaxID=557557 RepID=A0A841SZN2_9BACL|nr:peptidoglycan editing factor PgeF [Cohnella thailandensis]MBB6636319.1 peptidoglycan editing factor PgeF [Cohnella thailandensis]MBP1973711.1 YfiH family protein [Cohnella thailandensis]